ncbi:MAG: YdeI/OmpD-associated family protein [Terriglobales bacterium]
MSKGSTKSRGGESPRGVRRFRATLERMRSRLNWTIIRVPFDAAKVYGVRGQINVKGSINGFEFRTCLFPSKAGGHILLVNKKMQVAAQVHAGATAEFCLEPDTKKRVAAVPDRLKRILGEDRELRRWYEGLNQSTKNDIAKWVSEPKTEGARERRAEQIAERMMAVMEAERELPPILQVVFARNPGAREGWERMSAARRRAHLMAIFYYRTPEGQGRRIEKMLLEAEGKSL